MAATLVSRVSVVSIPRFLFKSIHPLEVCIFFFYNIAARLHLFSECYAKALFPIIYFFTEIFCPKYFVDIHNKNSTVSLMAKWANSIFIKILVITVVWNNKIQNVIFIQIFIIQIVDSAPLEPDISKKDFRSSGVKLLR
jgi:hypothetical protein